MIDLLREIAQTLRNNRLRTVLTGVSVAWGIFILILLLGASRGLINYFNDFASAESSNVISIWGGYTTKPFKGYKEGRQIKLQESDADAISKNVSDRVVKVSRIATIDSASIATSKGKVNSLTAVYPDEQTRIKLKYLKGRFINDRDIAEKRRVIVLSDFAATTLFPTEEKALGATVNSMGVAWTVVGVAKQDWNRQNFIPYSTYKSITGNSKDVEQLNVILKDIDTEGAALSTEKDVVSVLGNEHSFAADDRSAVWTWNRLKNYLEMNAVGIVLEIGVWVLGLLFLLTGLVGVSNIVFVSVRERTHEIGIRRAIGAKPRSILTQVILESVAITGLFGYMGLFLGMFVLQIASTIIPEGSPIVNPTVDISLALKVTIALIVAGALAGLFPALKAIKIKPVEALRDE